MNTDILIEISVGGLLGIVGQVIRTVSGLAKLYAGNLAATQANQPVSTFSTSRLVVSLLIGFSAGVVAVIVKGWPPAAAERNTFILAIIAAGYSGADFLEGIFTKYLPQASPAQKSSGGGGNGNQNSGNGNQNNGNQNNGNGN